MMYKFSFLTVVIYSSLFVSCFNKVNQVSDKTIVAIQPLGNCNPTLIDSIAQKSKRFYGVEVVVYPNQSILPKAYINIKSPRYRADTIIDYLKQTKPDSVDYILAITNVDISTTKKDAKGNIKKPVHKYKDWGIFGLGYRPGPTCIISTYRMGSSIDLKTERAQKVALHELGHNFGLPHCANKNCFMQDGAESIKTVDKVNFNLCNSCKYKLGI